MSKGVSTGTAADPIGSASLPAWAVDASLEQITRSLAGNVELADMLPAAYDELRKVAAAFLQRERSGHTLQPTALVHEAYLRLRDQRGIDFSNRAQFFAVAARLMRRILLDHSIARHAAKRGGGAPRAELDVALQVFDDQALSIAEINRTLTELEQRDPRQAQIAELRFFGGLTVPETADALGISPATVKREWNTARLWLAREMRASP